jgi:hypothetical protein
MTARPAIARRALLGAVNRAGQAFPLMQWRQNHSDEGGGVIRLAQADALLQWAVMDGESNLGRNVFGANCKCRATPKTYTKKMLPSKGLKMSKIWRLTQCCFCGWTAEE